MRQNVKPYQISLFDSTQNGGIFKRERESRRPCHIKYDSIISLENLLTSWQEFLRGKRKRKDVSGFSLKFMDNIFKLRRELINKEYRHGPYHAFKINDPKPRDIHKAKVRDRIVHHAIYRTLYPYFDNKFIYDSYSCRIDKGTHRAINRFRDLARKVSKNDTKTAWILKGDIKKFFTNIDHEALKGILRRTIKDNEVMWLLENVIDSFDADSNANIGLPLGNVTSQLLINIYMNEFDQFVKRELKVKYYIRYADDFVVLHKDKQFLVDLIPKISEFLEKELKLSLHPNKLYIKTLSSGIDFLGWVNFPHHRVLRTSTKRRMFRRLLQKQTIGTINSYLGLLKHGNTHKLILNIRNNYYLLWGYGCHLNLLLLV
jgi:retron-type reverse transcriptase